MRLLVTGAHGTLGPKVVATARHAGHEVVEWNRDDVDPNNPGAVHYYVETVNPDAIIHMALGAESWAGQLAGLAAARQQPFIFTSTTMVFDETPDGPYTIESPRTSTNDYGRYKIRCEDAIWASNPAAMVARIGYQIDFDAQGNNMVAHIDGQYEKDGVVRASTAWIPACSFMLDTADTLLALVASPVRGLHHVDANSHDAWTYFDIVHALRAHLRRDWVIEASEHPRQDQRMLGPTSITPLHDRLQRDI